GGPDREPTSCPPDRGDLPCFRFIWREPFGLGAENNFPLRGVLLEKSGKSGRGCDCGGATSGGSFERRRRGWQGSRDSLRHRPGTVQAHGPAGLQASAGLEHRVLSRAVRLEQRRSCEAAMAGQGGRRATEQGGPSV